MRTIGRYFLIISVLFTASSTLIAQTLTSIVPNNATQGQSLGVTITGQNTHFMQGSSSLISIVPNNAKQGQSLGVTITGQNTHFMQGSSTTSVWFSQGSSTINASSFGANSNTSLSASFNIPSGASTGSYDVKVAGPVDGTLTLPNGFTVRGKEFMITFDDGPVPGNTKNIVDALKNVKVDGVPVKAGFFMVGCDSSCEDTGAPRPLLGWLAPWPFEWCRTKGSVRGNSEIVKYVDAAGHIIGNHTQHHMWFWWPSVDEQDVNAEITACNNELQSALGKTPPKIFRPPYFVDNSDVRTGAGEYQIIMGAGDNEDSATGDLGLCPFLPPSVLTVEKNAANLIRTWDRDYPCVLTFHDISPTTSDHIAEIIEYLQEEGFTLVHFDPSRLPGSLPSLVHHATNTIHQSETVIHTVSLDSTVSTATFNVSWGGSDLNMVLYKPDGTKIDPNSTLVDPNIKYADRGTYEYYTISDPNPGDWIMEVSGVIVPPEGEEYTIRVEGDTNLTLFAFTDKPDYVLNEQINLKANLVNDENSVTSSLVVAKIQRPDGSVDNINLYDDGSHGDEDPNDGFYANAYDNTSIRGLYKITTSAIGELTGDQYERASSLTVMVGSIIYGHVDFGAYAVFANHWMDQNCTEPCWCDTADLDQNGEVNILDLEVLVEHWLEGT